LRLAALASECPLTRRRQLLVIGLGTSYLSSSAGAKQKRQDAKAIEELISDQVENDPIKHLEILEYMASKFWTNHPTVEPAQQTLLALQVLEGVKDFLKTPNAIGVCLSSSFNDVVIIDINAIGCRPAARQRAQCNQLQQEIKKNRGQLFTMKTRRVQLN
jgi:hypothetical protein